jgi:hypothetical protein
VDFFTSKLMKIRWSFLFSGSFAPYFLSTYGSNLNSIFVIMSELKFFLLMGVLIQNFNTMDLIKLFEKKSKTSHLDRSGGIEINIMENHELKKSEKV